MYLEWFLTPKKLHAYNYIQEVMVSVGTSTSVSIPELVKTKLYNLRSWIGFHVSGFMCKPKELSLLDMKSVYTFVVMNIP